MLQIIINRFQKNELLRLFESDGYAFLHIGVISIFLSSATIVGTIYFEIINDKVTKSHSVGTFVAITFVLMAVLTVVAVLEKIRAEILYRISNRLLYRTSKETFISCFTLFEDAERVKAFYSYHSDLLAVRQFIMGKSLPAIYDFAVIPIFVFLLFLMNSMLGFLSVALIIIILFISVRQALAQYQHENLAAKMASEDILAASNIISHSQTSKALGMNQVTRNKWIESISLSVSRYDNGSICYRFLDGAQQFFNRMLSATVLALGLWLVIKDDLGPGNAIGCMLLSGKISQQLSILVHQLPEIIKSYISYRRLTALLFGRVAVSLQSHSSQSENHSLDSSKETDLFGIGGPSI